MASASKQEDSGTKRKRDQEDTQKGRYPDPADIKVLIHLKNPKVDDQSEFFGGVMGYPLIAYCLEQLQLYKEIIIFLKQRLTPKLASDFTFMKENLQLRLHVCPTVMPTTGAILDFAFHCIDFGGHPFLLLRLDLVMDFPFQAMVDLNRQLLQKNIEFEAIMVAAKVDRPWLFDEVCKIDDKNTTVEVPGEKQSLGREPKANGEGQRKQNACSKGKSIEVYDDNLDLLDSSLKVTCYIPGAHPPGWINTRLYLMKPSILGLTFSPGEEIESNLIRELVTRGTLFMLPHKGVFFDMPGGFESGFTNFFSYMTLKARDTFRDSIWIDETTYLDPANRIDENVIIGPGCVIEGEVELQRCIILGEVRICNGAIVTDSVIGSEVVLGPHSTVTNSSVIAKGVTVESQVNVEHALALAACVHVAEDIDDTIRI